MKYKAIAKIFSHSFLRGIGQDIYTEMRFCPVKRALLEMGKVLRSEGPNKIEIHTSLHKNEMERYVSIQDESFSLVNVTLPQPSRWRWDGVAEPAGPWLDTVIADAVDSRKVDALFEIQKSRFTVNEVAKVTRQSPRRLIRKISQAIICHSNRSDKLLFDAVHANEKKASEWRIDLNGYFLSVLGDQIFPQSNGVAADPEKSEPDENPDGVWK